MQTGKDILLILLAGLTFYFAFRYRKKDFQITILKEQIAAYKDLVKNLFQTTAEINNLYNKKIGDKFMSEGDKILDNLEIHQRFLFVEFGEKYNESFKRFQENIFLFPEDVIDATMSYYNYFSELFEKNNDAELGYKLITELNQKIYDVINVIRNHTAIDDITIETKNLLSKRQQLNFVEE